MKLTYISSLICLFFALVSCQKKTNYQVYFYQNVDETRPFHLELDEEPKGTVPFLDLDANCEDGEIQANSLVIELEAGTYRYKLLDSSNEIVSEGKFKISSRKISSSGGKGSLMLQASGNCAAARMGE